MGHPEKETVKNLVGRREYIILSKMIICKNSALNDHSNTHSSYACAVNKEKAKNTHSPYAYRLLTQHIHAGTFTQVDNAYVTIVHSACALYMCALFIFF